MKLAEALLQRAEYQKKLENLQNRIVSNLKVQEGDKPFEDPNALLAEAMQTNDALCELVQKINKRNNATKLPDGRKLCDALAQRDMLLKKRNILTAVTAKSRERDPRLSHSEVKMVFTLSVEEVQKQIDGLSREYTGSWTPLFKA